MVHRRERDETEELTNEQRRELASDTFARWGESAFDSKEEKHRAWEAHREELPKQYVEENPSKRPWSWWQFEAPGDRPVVMEDRLEGAPRDLANEAAWLLEFGKLGEKERRCCPPPSPAEIHYIHRCT